MLGGMLDSWKLKSYYKQELSEYSVLRRRGLSDLDAKIQMLKSSLELDNGVGISLAIKQGVDELDVFDEIQFLVWFNASLRTKRARIPLVASRMISTRERSVLSDIAFRSGDWWMIKEDLKESGGVSMITFNALGKELAERFKLA
mgnify:CR=1 FL=1